MKTRARVRGDSTKPNYNKRYNNEVISEEEDLEPEDDDGLPRPPEPKRLLNFRTAMGVYAVLAVLSVLTLTGKFLIFSLLVLAGFAVLTYTQHLREKPDD